MLHVHLRMPLLCFAKASFVKGKIVNTPDVTVELLDECQDMFEQLKVYDNFKDILTVEDFVHGHRDNQGSNCNSRRA